MIIYPKELIYFPAEYVLDQGCKKGEGAHKTQCGFLRPRSHGWSEEFARSELYINAELPSGDYYLFKIDDQIRPIIGRITKKRVAKMLTALPESLTMVQIKASKSKFTIFEADLFDWLEAAGL